MVSCASQNIYMRRGFHFFFTAALILCFTEPSLSKQPDNTLKAKKILDLQAEVNGFKSSEQMVNAIRNFNKNDPRKNILNDPNVTNIIKNEIDESYIKEMSRNLSPHELDYLISLYSSPMYQKYIKLEREFWNNKAHKILNDKLSAYQKKAQKK